MTSTMAPAPGTPEQTSNVNLFIGCGLAVGGNILISISLNVQKYAHMKIEEDTNAKHYTRYPIWWLGLVLMGLGELGNFTAYGFAPASLVAPLGTTAVIANMFIAVVFLKEKLRVDDIFGVTFAVVGAFLLVNFSQKGEVVLDADELVDHLTGTGFIVYVVIELLALAVLFTMKYRWHMDNILVLLLIANFLASFTIISTKGLSGMLQLTFGGNMQLDHVIFWAMLGVLGLMCFLQIKYLNQAMQLFDATIVVPTNFVFFTISAIVAGIIFYREFWGLSALDIFMFLFGCMMCFVGVYFITAGRVQSDDSETRNIVNALKRDGLFKYLPTWLVASESEVRTLSRTNSRQPRSSLSPSTNDYTPILKKTSSLSSNGSLNSYHDQDSPAPDRRGDTTTAQPAIQEVPENGSTAHNNNDNLPLKTYGTTAKNES